MVATNPLFAGGSFYKKFQATVINDIWPEVAFFSLVATMVTLVSKLTPHDLSISNAMLTVLGTVLGLVISFRTSTAYERFSEGRKLWTNIAIASRNLAQVIWIHVPFDRVDKATGEKKPHLQVVIEKKSMINLVQAYSVAVKHMLRGEGGVYYADLYPMISFLPRFSQPLDKATEEDMLPLWKASDMDHDAHRSIRTETLMSTHMSRSASSPLPQSSEDGEKSEKSSWFGSKRVKRAKFDPEMALPVLPSERPLLPARNPPESSLYDYFGFLRIFKPIIKPFSRRLRQVTTPPEPMSARGRTITGKRIRPELADSNVPVEIALFLTTYFASLMRQGLLTPASATAMNNAITTLQDTVVNLERIRSTPLPFAYQAHLRLSLWLYLFFLPFQVYSAFKWLTIPATAFAAFLLCGFLEIGQEIENPFNYDLNDLDLDQFCLAIQRELHEVTAHTTPDPESFIFTEWNQPFAPADRRNAKEMLSDIEHAYHGLDTGVHHIRRTLIKSWADVDEMTRK
ncbi:Bestrophin, RFP-TM, chloride channel-domain-containing protein [Phanerochaete sordida]|uniref:Bestrophin, RFP-TM, chloride channel-domain-containing protein n=1 Tax=Phanerochaete sordida TaxID=48140 RepID=A0A9P3G2Y9_9APHY|nr:Bestrophin, RFP-TM, chloride channel-domain-containing protein [Phanerochaete sordida]